MSHDIKQTSGKSHGSVSSLFHARLVKSVIIRNILIIFKEPTAYMSDSVREEQASNPVH